MNINMFLHKTLSDGYALNREALVNKNKRKENFFPELLINTLHDLNFMVCLHAINYL